MSHRVGIHLGCRTTRHKKYKKRSSRAAKAHVRILAGTHTAKNSYFNKTEQMIVERKELKNGQNEMVAEKKKTLSSRAENANMRRHIA